MCDAIVRTLWRLLVTRRKLLEWETAAADRARLGTSLANFIERHVEAPRRWPLAIAAVVVAPSGRLRLVGGLSLPDRLVPLAARRLLGQPAPDPAEIAL